MTITKTMLYSFLDKKERAAEQKVEDTFNAQIDVAVKEMVKDKTSGIGKIIYDNAAAYQLIYNNEEIIGVSDASRRRGYHTLKDYYYSLAFENIDELVLQLAERYYKNSEDYETKRQMKNEILGNIRKEYRNLNENLKSMKNGKECIKYLTELGFDLSEFDEDTKKNNFLAHTIDARYLMLEPKKDDVQ